MDRFVFLVFCIAFRKKFLKFRNFFLKFWSKEGDRAEFRNYFLLLAKIFFISEIFF